MYCSSCGVAVAQGLSYCNYCGAKLSGAKGDNVIKSSEVKPENLVEMMVAVFVCGLVAIMGLMAVMKAVLDLNVGQILAFTLLSFLIMLLIEGVFIRLLLRRKRGAEEAGDTVLLKEQATKELDAAQGRVLPEPVPSVSGWGNYVARVRDFSLGPTLCWFPHWSRFPIFGRPQSQRHCGEIIDVLRRDLYSDCTLIVEFSVFARLLRRLQNRKSETAS